MNFSSFLDQVQANIRKYRFLVLSGPDQNIQILNLPHSNEDSPIYSRKIIAWLRHFAFSALNAQLKVEVHLAFLTTIV